MEFNDIFEFADINCCSTNIGDNSKIKFQIILSVLFLFLFYINKLNLSWQW